MNIANIFKKIILGFFLTFLSFFLVFTTTAYSASKVKTQSRINPKVQCIDYKNKIAYFTINATSNKTIKILTNNRNVVKGGKVIGRQIKYFNKKNNKKTVLKVKFITKTINKKIKIVKGNKSYWKIKKVKVYNPIVWQIREQKTRTRLHKGKPCKSNNSNNNSNIQSPFFTTSNPLLIGNFKVGSLISINNIAYIGTQPITVNYIWQKCNDNCIDYKTQSSSALLLTNSELNNKLRLKITIRNNFGYEELYSNISPIITN